MNEITRTLMWLIVIAAACMAVVALVGPPEASLR
jgi:hypothetical protein